MKIISEFFCTDSSGKKKIQIRLTKAELRYHPHLYLIQFLLFCEKNSISSKNIRVMYVDYSCTFNDHLIRLRFPEFVSNIFYVTCPNEIIKIPDILEHKEACTILITDIPKSLNFINSSINCDFEISLITRDD